GEVKIKGTAIINGKSVVREARAASITWPVQPQQNIATLSRLDRAVVMAVRDKAPYLLAATVQKLTVQNRGKITIPLKLTRINPDFKAAFQVPAQPNYQELLIPSLQIPQMNIAAGDGTITINNLSTAVPPGRYNLVFRGQGQMPYNRDPTAKNKPNMII